MSDKSSSKAIRDNLYKNLGNVSDSNISEKQSNTICMDKNNENDNLLERINISVLTSRMDFLRKYKKETGVPPATKCTELLNEAIDIFEREYKAKKDSKR